MSLFRDLSQPYLHNMTLISAHHASSDKAEVQQEPSYENILAGTEMNDNNKDVAESEEKVSESDRRTPDGGIGREKKQNSERSYFNHPDIRGNNRHKMSVGLTNLGNTCYMNAALQILFAVPSLNTLLRDSEQLRQNEVGLELSELVRKAGSGTYTQLSTAPLKRALSNANRQYCGYEQHDSHELLIYLLDYLHESIQSLNSGFSEGVPAENDFVMETSLTLKEHNNTISGMNIFAPNIVDDNLNSLSVTPQKGRVHENLPINLIEDRQTDSTLHKNIYHNIQDSKKFPEKPLFRLEGLIPEKLDVHPINSESAESYVNISVKKECTREESDCSRSIDSNTPIIPDHGSPLTAWKTWEQKNSTPISDTFYGQLVTHTTCCHCGHTTVKYAPFMQLSLPLPHATDKNLIITWISKLNPTPERYLVSLSQFSTVYDVKMKLLGLLERQDLTSHDISITEVYKGRVYITHTEVTSVRYINTTQNSVFAYERIIVEATPESKKPGSTQEDTNVFTNNLDSDNYNMIKEKFKDSNIEQNIDIDKDCKQFKNKLELFDPKAKIENKPAGGMEHEPANNLSDPGTRDIEGGADWSHCVICLEEFPPYLILTHVSCKMTICRECYDSLREAYATLTCPVCGDPIGELELLGEKEATSPSLRWFEVVLLMSYSDKLVGYPLLLECPSRVHGDTLLLAISELLGGSVTFRDSSNTGPAAQPPPECVNASLYIADSDNLLDREAITADQTYDIIPTSALLITLASFPASFQEKLSTVRDTSSIQRLDETLKPLDLEDCLNAFVKSEELCGGNTWFCEECDRERIATTSISISNLPPYLILQLNRFIVSNNILSQTEKISCPVHLPLCNLDLSSLTLNSIPQQPSYSLAGIIHHTGGINSGHYTAQVLSPYDEQWRYYNDTTVSHGKTPLTYDREGNLPSLDTDARSAYVLLYKQDLPDVSVEMTTETIS